MRRKRMHVNTKQSPEEVPSIGVCVTLPVALSLSLSLSLSLARAPEGAHPTSLAPHLMLLYARDDTYYARLYPLSIRPHLSLRFVQWLADAPCSSLLTAKYLEHTQATVLTELLIVMEDEGHVQHQRAGLLRREWGTDLVIFVCKEQIGPDPHIDTRVWLMPCRHHLLEIRSQYDIPLKHQCILRGTGHATLIHLQQNSTALHCTALHRTHGPGLPSENE